MFVRKRTPTAGEHGVHQTISENSSASGLLQRANPAGKSLCDVRPQADSYRRTPRPPNHSIAPRRSALAREHGVHQTISENSSASGLLQRANAAGKSLCDVRPQADSYRRTPRPPNHSIAPGRSSLASERGVHQTISENSSASGLLQRANTAGKSLCDVRPQADSYRRTPRPPNHSIARRRSSLASERGGHRTIATGSSASGLLQGANTARTETNQRSLQPW